MDELSSVNTNQHGQSVMSGFGDEYDDCASVKSSLSKVNVLQKLPSGHNNNLLAIEEE